MRSLISIEFPVPEMGPGPLGGPIFGTACTA